MRKKLLTCIFAVTISAMMLAGCGNNTDTVKEPTTTQAATATSAPTQPAGVEDNRPTETPEVTEAPETTDVPEVTEVPGTTPEITPEVTEVPRTTPEITPEVTGTPEDIEVSSNLFINSIKELADKCKKMDTSIVNTSSELDISKFDFTFINNKDERQAANFITDKFYITIDNEPTLSNGKPFMTSVEVYNYLVEHLGSAPNEIWTPSEYEFIHVNITWVVDETHDITLECVSEDESYFALHGYTARKPYESDAGYGGFYPYN